MKRSGRRRRLGRVRLTEFHDLVEGQFGKVRATSMLVDHVLTGLGGAPPRKPSRTAWIPAMSGVRCARISTSRATSGEFVAALAQQLRCLPMQPAEVVVRRARPLGGHHACADRRLRCARGAEHLALPRLDDALEHLAALARLRVGDPHAGHRELAARRRTRRSRRCTFSALCEMKPSPRHSKCGRSSNVSDISFSAWVLPSVGHHPRVLVLDLAAALADLLQQHVHRGEDVQRLESGHHHRFSVHLGHEPVRPSRRPLWTHGRARGSPTAAGRVTPGSP